ncbi:hypothetical protein J3458_022189 [Metarhizium acridum]|uniref:uncharacterized protein n=1 Tax=Metarhizium acridum TaxID=92637 RepID=UPI001C6B795E|nr:hypothetical protein J3458_022189 [Metarhizium acridum]
MAHQRWALLALSVVFYLLLAALPGSTAQDTVQRPRYIGQLSSSTLESAPLSLQFKESINSVEEPASGHLNKRLGDRITKVETKYIDLAFYSRGQYLEANPDAIANRDFKSFHWAIVTRSRNSPLADAFDASDSISVQQGTTAVSNEVQEGGRRNFLFQYKYGVKPEKANSLSARVNLGKTKTSTKAITEALQEVPIPNCQESCVDWALGAITKLQEKGMLPTFDVGELSRKAFDYSLNTRTALRLMIDRGETERFFRRRLEIAQYQNGGICKKRPKL